MREPMASLMTGTACFPDQIPEKMIELLLVPDFEQLAGKLHLLAFAEDFLQLAWKFELPGLEFPVLHTGLELGAIDIMHDVLRASPWCASLIGAAARRLAVFDDDLVRADATPAAAPRASTPRVMRPHW